MCLGAVSSAPSYWPASSPVSSIEPPPPPVPENVPVTEEAFAVPEMVPVAVPLEEDEELTAFGIL